MARADFVEPKASTSPSPPPGHPRRPSVVQGAAGLPTLGLARAVARGVPGSGEAGADLDPEALYQRVAPVIYTRCLRLLGHEQDARDATHDIFVGLLNGRMGSFRAEAKLSTWIYSVATRHCLDRLRSAKRKRSFLERWGALFSSRQQELPAPGQAEARLLLEELSGRLRARSLQIAVHLYLDEMTQQEVAELMGISERAVRKAMTKIRKDAVCALSGAAQTCQEEESNAH